MHIVFVTTELASNNNSSGGLASFTSNIAKIFAQQGHQVSVVLASTKNVSIDFDSNVNIYSLFVPMYKWKLMDLFSKIFGRITREDIDEMRKMFVNLNKARQVKKIVRNINRRDKIDIIHYCNHGSLNLLSSEKIPYVVRISGFLNIWNGVNVSDGSIQYTDNPLSIKDKLEEYTMRKSKYVISPSHLIALIAKNNLGIDPVVIESPFVLERTEWDYSILNKFGLGEKKYIIHYGRLTYLKGTHIVAQISKEFLKQHMDYYIVVSGNNLELLETDGTKVKAEEYVKKYAGEFADRVIYVGRLVREQLYPLIQNAELCLLPSRIENLSNACIEAMAMGKIVVATNGASYEQLIDDGISGFLCERDNANSYLQAVNKVLNMNPDERNKMGLKAIEVTKRLEPQKIYQQYLAYYEKVIREW